MAKINRAKRRVESSLHEAAKDISPEEYYIKSSYRVKTIIESGPVKTFTKEEIEQYLNNR